MPISASLTDHKSRPLGADILDGLLALTFYLYPLHCRHATAPSSADIVDGLLHTLIGLSVFASAPWQQPVSQR
ncbi:MAG: hypothetical protein K8963_02840 [Proteobacteria bacterium]|nr:hypothetical protein [Pseudomonadota bacterium]